LWCIALGRGRDAHVLLRWRLLDEHLGRWLGPFLLAAHSSAQSDFYETLAELTEAVVRAEPARTTA